MLAGPDGPPQTACVQGARSRGRRAGLDPSDRTSDHPYGGAGDDDEHAEAVGASTATVGAPLRAGVDLLREVAMGSVAGAVGAIRSTHRRTPVRVLERMEDRSIGGVRSKASRSTQATASVDA